MCNNNSMLECVNLTRTFYNKNEIKTALNNIKIHIYKKEIFGIIGPNGAGKTTFINIITTMLYPTSYKKLTINNMSIIDNSSLIKRIIGVVPANSNSLYMKLTAKENLEFFGALYNMKYKMIKARVPVVLKLVELDEYENEYVENFSTGMKQRLLIARALLHEPEFLILDEPTSGLDPRTANKIRTVLLKINKKGITILLATHNMEEAETLCNRVAIFNKGEVITFGSPNELIENIGSTVTIMAVNSPIEKIDDLLNKYGINDYKLINSMGDATKIRFIDNKSNKTIRTILENNKCRIQNYETRRTSLEDVFFESLKSDVIYNE